MSGPPDGRGEAGSKARSPERGTATRRALLSAAASVFTEVGFAQAGVTDIVARAGASVGSLYHHFAGKADLFLTLFDEFQSRQQERTRGAVHTLRDAGERDPMRVFTAGARAFLGGSIEERELSRLFLSGDGPPGFELVLRRRLREWAGRNAALFEGSDAGDEARNEALVVVLTGAMVTAVSEVSNAEDDDRARQLADEVIEVMQGLAR